MTARLNRRLKTPDRDDVYFNSWLRLIQTRLIRKHDELEVSNFKCDFPQTRPSWDGGREWLGHLVRVPHAPTSGRTRTGHTTLPPPPPCEQKNRHI